MFYVIASSIILAINFYAYKRLLSKISFFNVYASFLFGVFIALVVCETAYAFSLRFNFLNPRLNTTFGLMLAFSFILFSFAIIYDLLLVALKPAKNVFSEQRRKFIRFCFDTVFLATILGYFFKGLFNAAKLPEIKSVRIDMKNLKSPLRVVALTDIHLGNFLGVEFATALVGRVNELDADMVVIVGDIADTSPQKLLEIGAPFRDFKSKFGTFFVPGNHEYYHGIEGMLDAVKGLGIKVLGNENISVGGINLAGVYDLAGLKFKKFEPDLDEALKGIDPGQPTVLLSHQPKFINSMDKDADLVICGHTHGGQIFPFSLLVLLDQPFLAGLYRVNDKMRVYVSRGAGFWGPPVRLLAPSEITLLELRRSDEK